MLAGMIAIHVELGRCQEGGGRQFVGEVGRKVPFDGAN